MSTTTTNRPAAGVIEPRNLINPNLFDQLATRISDEHQMPIEHAERVMEQALGFLYTCALNPDAALSPSPQVDIAWHAFILHTRPYAEFCETVAGRFLHHVPDDGDDGDSAEAAQRIGLTLDAMRAADLPVDAELWLTNGKCSQCYAGCASDPRRV
ncbi:glycine-rich domain-containing protein [Nonomuraea polychroma]|uniref:glycine-rich domain-containing protein n=1 Tax=Nonomuraea polychroma TaxID=46176 RepID=UPI003D9479F5